MTAPERIVSLVPSLTESVVDLGAGERLVGVTRYCPPVPSAAIVGGPRDPEIEAIVSLRPDLVLACREENSDEDLQRIAKTARVHAFSCRSVDDGLALIVEMGRLLARTDEAREAVRRIQARRGAVRQSVEGLARVGVHLPRPVFYPVWKEPWMALGDGCFPAAMLAEAGGVSVFADRGEPYPRIELVELRRRAPELILLPDEPWPFSSADLAELVPALAPAHPPMLLVPGRWAAWYGTRMDAGLHGLAAAIHGEHLSALG